MCWRLFWPAVEDLNMQSASLWWSFFFFFLTFLLFSCMAINPASTHPSLSLSRSFLLLVFIKLFLNFVYLFPFLMRFCSPFIFFPHSVVCFLCACFLLCLSTVNFSDPEDQPSFMGITLNSQIGRACASYRKVVFTKSPGFNCCSRVIQCACCSRQLLSSSNEVIKKSLPTLISVK